MRISDWSSDVCSSDLSRTCMLFTRTGLSPCIAGLSRPFRLLHTSHWADPRSLATTSGVSFDFLSSRYLDVSVPWVRFQHLCIHCRIPPKLWVSPFGPCRINACFQLPKPFCILPPHRNYVDMAK